jgi:aspartokinase
VGRNTFKYFTRSSLETKLESIQHRSMRGSVIVTNDDYTLRIALMPETFERTRAKSSAVLDHGSVPGLGGFIAATTDGRTTTLGREGPIIRQQ